MRLCRLSIEMLQNKLFQGDPLQQQQKILKSLFLHLQTMITIIDIHCQTSIQVFLSADVNTFLYNGTGPVLPPVARKCQLII
jgi:hypothetical protein